MPLNHGRKAAKCRPTQETLRRALARACVEFREDGMIQNICPGACAALAIALATGPAVRWKPNKPVEIVFAAGAGGASDQMARMMQAAVQKNNLMKQPMVVSLKGGASGAEALIYMKSNEGDPNKVLIAYSLIYMLPLSAKIPFNWRDLTPGSVFCPEGVRGGGKCEGAKKDGKRIRRRREEREPAAQDGRHRLAARRSCAHRFPGEEDRSEVRVSALQVRGRGSNPARRQSYRRQR